MVYLTRRERFTAAHRLSRSDWDIEKNSSTFGKCSNPNWHGHNYQLFVTVKGIPDPITGFVMDAKQLKSILLEHIINKLDHKNINLDVDFFPKDLQPTTENLVVAIWNELQPHITNCELHCIKLIETENIYAEYYG